MSSASTIPQTSESAARTILEQMKQKGGVKASRGEEELEDKERALRDALSKDIKKRDGFFVVGDTSWQHSSGIVQEEEEEE